MRLLYDVDETLTDLLILDPIMNDLHKSLHDISESVHQLLHKQNVVKRVMSSIFSVFSGVESRINQYLNTLSSLKYYFRALEDLLNGDNESPQDKIMKHRILMYYVREMKKDTADLVLLLNSILSVRLVANREDKASAEKLLDILKICYSRYDDRNLNYYMPNCGRNL